MHTELISIKRGGTSYYDFRSMSAGYLNLPIATRHSFPRKGRLIGEVAPGLPTKSIFDPWALPRPPIGDDTNRSSIFQMFVSISSGGGAVYRTRLKYNPYEIGAVEPFPTLKI